MKQIAFFVEGEEDRRARSEGLQLRRTLHRLFRELDELAQSKGVTLQFRFHGTRRAAYERFLHSFGIEDGVYQVLLVDSEEPVASRGQCWQHLENRPADGWTRPGSADDEQCQLMVQAIEAWLFADPEALAAFYGKGFGSLPKRRDVAEIPKASHLPALRKATTGTSKGEYHKVRHLSPLLYRLDPAKVRQRAFHFDRILTTLRRKLESL